MTPAQYNEYQRQADVIEQANKHKEEQESKQMTSIEKLIEDLEGSFSIIARAVGVKKYNEIVKNAIQMHKQEIMRAFIDGEENVWDRKNEGHEFQYENHEHYYTEKFKND
jgi:hypothetical protein